MLSIDPSEFRHHLDGRGLPVEQQDDMIRAVAYMVDSIIRLHVGTDSTQISLGISASGDPLSGSDRVESGDPITPTFNDTAEADAVRKTTP